MVTTMTNPSPNSKLTPELQEAIAATLPLMAMANALGYPEEWIVCDHCGAYGWRIPPHVYDPCPLVVQTVEAAGLKMDTERNQTIAAGLAMREHLEHFQKWMEREIGGDDE